MDGIHLKFQDCHQNCNTESGEVTPLQYCVIRWAHWESREGRAGHLRLLLDHGYNHCTMFSLLHRFDPAGVTEDTRETAIELAADREHEEAFAILAPYMEGTVALQLAKLIQSLRSKGAIKATDEPSEEFRSILAAIPPAELRIPVVCGMTMLQVVAEAGNVAYTQLFLEKGWVNSCHHTQGCRCRPIYQYRRVSLIPHCQIVISHT